jgi:C_GCAxxG_C_C family probable redox protein
MALSERLATKVALEMFMQNFNCAEVVLTGLVREFGLDCGCVPRIATAFGGGMGGQGRVCGALSGAMMALGLKFGRECAEDNESKAVTYGKVRELFRLFESEFGTCSCFDLIGIDLTTPEGLQQAKAVGLHANICAKYVRFVVAAASEMLESG